MNQSEKNQQEYLKNLGIYIEKNGDGFFMLKKLNGQPIKEHLNAQCSGGRPAGRNIPDAYNKTTGGNSVKGGAVNRNPKFEMLASYNNANPLNNPDNGIKGGAAPSNQNAKPNPTGDKAKFEIIASFENKQNNIEKGDQIQQVKISGDKAERKTDNRDQPIPIEYTFQSKKPTGAITHEYIVKPKDTLYGLSKKFNVTIKAISRLIYITNPTKRNFRQY